MRSLEVERMEEAKGSFFLPSSCKCMSGHQKEEKPLERETPKDTQAGEEEDAIFGQLVANGSKLGSWRSPEGLIQGRAKERETPKDTQAGEEEEGEELSVEQIFASAEVPPWWSQISIRGIFTSALLGSLFCVVVHKLSLTTGIIPSLHISAGLLSFFCIRIWTSLLNHLGIPCRPFTRQENTVIQTCIVACYGVAYSGGFSTYLLAMDQRTSDIVNATGKGHADNSADIKNPGLGWIIAYVFAASFLGLVAVVPLRKILIIDYKLTYPSGTATAVLINSFFTPHGFKQAQKQIRCLGKYFSFSFFFSLFKWHFSGPSGECGFDKFPSLGLKAYDNKFYFDFNMTYIGAGMICPHIVNFSLLFGGLLSWAVLWPLINNRAGDWYPVSATGSNLQGVYGYKVFIAIALILGDGLYNFVKVTFMTIFALYNEHRKRAILPSRSNDKGEHDPSPDEQRRIDFFLKDRIPFKVAGLCYVGLAAISLGVILKIFHEMKWYYVVLSYCVAPILGFCNAYGSGMTDWSLISSYGKLFLFIFSSWAGSQGGVIVGLVSCGLMMVIVSSAADLMQDFKTGYLTLASPRSMLASQVLGTIIGCIVAPATFWMFWKAFPVGQKDGQYPAPYAVIFREMALLGVQGFSTLPRHCLLLSFLFFVLAIIINVVRNWVPTKIAEFIPIPMAMALPFYIGSYFAIDMCIGSTIVYVWQKVNRRKANVYIPAVASGLMCGDGMWTLMSAILALAKRQAPIYLLETRVTILDFRNRKQHYEVLKRRNNEQFEIPRTFVNSSTIHSLEPGTPSIARSPKQWSSFLSKFLRQSDKEPIVKLGHNLMEK